VVHHTAKNGPVLRGLVQCINISDKLIFDRPEHAGFLQQKYHGLQMQAKKRKISSRVGYLEKMIQAELEQQK
jgi:hypothetical protein